MASADAAATLERALALRRIAGLEALDPELLTVLAAQAEVRALAQGEALPPVLEGARSLRFVIAGRVRTEGGEAHGPGSLVDAGGARGRGAVALEESLTLALDMDALTELCEEHFGLLLAVTRGLARAQLVRWRARPPAADAPHPPDRQRVAALDDLGERVAFLAGCPALAGIPVHSIGQLAQGARALSLRPGELLWSAGEPADSVVALVDGAVEARADGNRFAIGPCALAGLLESIAAEPRWYTAEARTPVRALAIEIASVFDAAEDDSETAAHLLAALARSWSLSLETPAP
jgi:CRP-like cAMP-binding protein